MIKKMLLLTACLAGLVPLAADAPSDFRQALELIVQAQADQSAGGLATDTSADGNKAKTQALELFAKAAIDYERQAGADYRRWYEAGNARWWAQQAGRAILDYRRYLAHDPFRAEVWENLAQARASAGTLAPGGEGIGAWPWTIWLLHALALGAGLAALAAGLWLWSRRRAWLRLAIGLAALALLCGAGIGWQRLAPARLAVVLAETQGRKGDAAVYAAQPTQPWNPGQEAWITERRAGWARLDVGGTTSWVPESAIEEIAITLP